MHGNHNTLPGATDLLAGFARREYSPVEVLQDHLDRIDRFEPHLNAFVCLDVDAALKTAKTSEARWAADSPIGLLDGVPFAAKDLSPLTGFPLRRGSRLTSDLHVDQDTPALAMVKSNGAVIVGKTTTPEFGWKGVTDSPLTGVTRNPWNLAKTPGGSSGGAAAALASGMVTLAEGTDGAGSIRMPCGFTGLFGLYPTAGRIPYVPVSTLGTITQAGPMARSVADGALLFCAMIGRTRRDPVNLPDNMINWQKTLAGGVRGTKLAYSRTLGFAQPDADVVARVDAAVEVLRRMGATITEVDPVLPSVREPFEKIYSVAMARISESFPQDDPDTPVDPGLQAMADYGRSLSGVELNAALSLRDHCAQELNGFFHDYDALITPQLPLTAFDAGLDFPAGRGMSHWFDWSPYTYLFNFTNNPAGTMPCGFGDDGMPIAFQIVTARYDEAAIFRIAAAFETAQPIAQPDMSTLARIETTQ